MARKKPARKKKSTGKKIPASRKKLANKKRAVAKGRAAKKKPAAKKKSSPRKAARVQSRAGGRREVTHPTPSGLRGLGADSAGQSGDTQGLSRREFDDSESVEELLEEGQYAEAGVVSGVENAPEADQGEVRTREVPEDDVPQEYLDED